MKSYTHFNELLEYMEGQFHNNTLLNDKVNNHWESLSVEQFTSAVRKCAAGLRYYGVQKGDGVAIISDTNKRWLIMDLAIMSIGAVSVPMFPNVSMGNLEFQLADSKVNYVYIASDLKLDFFIDHHKRFKKIITQNSIQPNNDHFTTYRGLLRQGQLSLSKSGHYLYGSHVPVYPNDLATIVYTSGSMGEPKGVELSHKNLIHQLTNIKDVFHIESGTDSAVSFLPTAHIFERTVVYFYLSRGISIHFVPNVKMIGDIIREVRPTILTVVPRVLEKVYNKMVSKARTSSFIKSKLALGAIKRANKRKVNTPPHRIDYFYNKLVYRKFRAALGGRLRMIISGGAPLSRQLIRFYSNIGLEIYQGYGLTESSPVIAANHPGNNKYGTVGPVLPGVRVVISPEGEILAGGENIMMGYHNRPEETRAVIDEHGLLHTGDLGSLDDDGYLTITGRKKELFKTSTGKYVSPIGIEQKLNSSELISNAMIVAEGRKYVSCLIFPVYEDFDALKQKWNLTNLSREAFYDHPQVQEALHNHIDCVNMSLNPWERIGRYKLIMHELSIDQNELTPKLNLRRNYLYQRYQKEIESMYHEEVHA